MQTTTISLTSKPKTEIPTPKRVSHEEMFKVAFQGLCSGAQFYSLNPDGQRFYMDSKEELKLLKHLAYLAYNGACYATEIYNQNAEFSNKV